MVIKSEDLSCQREPTLERIFEFIGVDLALVPVDVVREWNRGDQEKKKRRIDSTLRRIPAYRLLARVSPEPLRKLKRRLVTEEIRNRPTISDDVKQELEDRVRDDVRRLHDYAGPDFDGWGIA